jgi:phosphatidylserine/phosphatidylglycerophosphate/cardiolipin synthase-like enzyme
MEGELLFGDEFFQVATERSKKLNSELVAMSAFIKQEAIEKLEKDVNENVDVSIVARWRPDDLISGVSDISLFPFCEKKGWRFGIKQQLHAKVIVFDRSHVLLGSSNITGAGLGFSFRPNEELNVSFDASGSDIKKIYSLLDRVTWVSKEVYEKLCCALESLRDENPSPMVQWPEEILSLLVDEQIDELWASDIPADFFDATVAMGHDEKILKQNFYQSVVLQWLLQELKKDTKGYTNFGWLSSKLHGALIVDPRISRKEVKVHVAIVFDWVLNCANDLINVQQHRHTKSLQLL